MRCLAFALPLLAANAASAQGDANAGRAIFEAQCTACHSAEPGVHGVGPSLAGLAGRAAGSVAGFDFTAALKNSGVVWSETTFDAFMTDPAKSVPGTSMAIMLPEAKERSDVFAYLATLKDVAAATQSATAPAAKTVTGPSQADLDNAAQGTDWLYASRDYAGTRFVPLDQITPANAKDLRPVCLYRGEQTAPAQTSPLVHDGVMYLTFARLTVAIDAVTCRERWTHTWQPKGKELSTTNRGGAIKDGVLVRGTADGHLIALDMGGGQLLWSREIAGAGTSQYVSMPPLIWNDLIIVGPAGADFGAKNWAGAFRLGDGEPVWRFNLIPDPGEPGAETWADPEAAKRGGASLWTPVSLDHEAGVVYLPVGNPAPDFFGAVRPGDNLYTNSLVALDARAGKRLWHRQFVAHDVHDADLSQVSPLFRLNGGSGHRDVVAVSGKDGLLRLLDRKTHEQLYEVPITTRENVNAAPTVEGVHRCPGLLGGMEWNGPAFDPKNNALYVAAVDWCGTFKAAAEKPAFSQGMHYYGGAVTSDPRDKAKGWLTAFDAATGKERWKYAARTPLVAGVTATSGGVIFTGDLNNDFLAFDAKTGAALYRFNTGGSLGGGVVSYARDGKQYVAAVSGTVSAFFGGSWLTEVVVFALP